MVSYRQHMHKLVLASTLHKHITQAVTKTSRKSTVTNYNTNRVCVGVCVFLGGKKHGERNQEKWDIWETEAQRQTFSQAAL